MNFGLSQKSIDLMTEVFAQWQEIDKVCVFGSRAMGNYKKGSDVDLVVYGLRVTDEIINRIRVQLNEELPLPYYYDVLHYESLKNEDLKNHIDTFGKAFYVRGRENN